LGRLAVVLIGMIALLWSWNTLAAMFGAPQAQFRHVVALLVLLTALRGLVLPAARHAGRHGRQGHGVS
jgi:hypothetical protein